jgi:dihydrofolate reductase
MTMSLDGFVADRNGSVERLYPDLEALRETQFLKDIIDITGAVIMGRNAYDMAQGDLTGYEFQVPVFVLTHHPPARPAKGQNDRLTVSFVTDGIESAVRRARAAAGDRNVTVVGGPDTIAQLMRAGLLDELEVGIRPVPLGAGLRLFPEGATGLTDVARTEVIELPGVTYLRFRMVDRNV